MIIKLVNITDNPEDIIIRAMTFCTGKTPDWDKHVVPAIKADHSVSEHINMSFELIGISNPAARQILRHRISSPLQRSQRYSDESESELYHPPNIGNALWVYDDIGDKCRQAYKELIKMGMNKEDARNILPFGTLTNVFLTINLRSLIHMCSIRLCTHAMPEVREIMKEMKSCIMDKYPRIGVFLVPDCEALGFCRQPKCCGLKKHISEFK